MPSHVGAGTGAVTGPSAPLECVDEPLDVFRDDDRAIHDQPAELTPLCYR